MAFFRRYFEVNPFSFHREGVTLRIFMGFALNPAPWDYLSSLKDL